MRPTVKRNTYVTLIFCAFKPVKIVCGKLRVHPAQPDIPAGGRGAGAVQQNHNFGKDCQQEQQSDQRQPRWLLQRAEQIAREWGERGERF